ncbi:cbb3-type cytochrome c oxidase subunit 3 [Litoribacillus peritrichatus]|uniref:CcoQ/FixQ family Cbb3-type cytochrome c oxidase assembly chaperone n=1 Tax=Litoribacillus peritrichatus TaxID=718191 RepID=A0ABP7N509_9GAMM
MDINDLRSISTVLMAVVFTGILLWAYSSKRKKPFDEAANLPFIDDDSSPSERKNQE